MTKIEERKIRKLKEVGFNAIRTAHNPPSAALIEACDRIGMYVFDEAFDAWSMGKRAGDYNQFFASDWERDLSSFVKRDRTHPSVIMWSTGNEIPERGGLGGGYARAARLAETIRSLDGTRPVSNGICSFWSGLDDALAKGRNQAQNSGEDEAETLWEKARNLLQTDWTWSDITIWKIFMNGIMRCFRNG
jgi:beta-galactosidase